MPFIPEQHRISSVSTKILCTYLYYYKFIIIEKCKCIYYYYIIYLNLLVAFVLFLIRYNNITKFPSVLYNFTIMIYLRHTPAIWTTNIYCTEYKDKKDLIIYKRLNVTAKNQFNSLFHICILYL